MTWLTLLAAVLLAAAAGRQAAAHPRVRAAYRFSGHRGATPAWADELRRWNAADRAAAAERPAKLVALPSDVGWPA